jgi:hypothetical protein
LVKKSCNSKCFQWTCNMRLHVGVAKGRYLGQGEVGLPLPLWSNFYFPHCKHWNIWTQIYEMIGKLYYTNYTLKYKHWIRSYLITFWLFGWASHMSPEIQT